MSGEAEIGGREPLAVEAVCHRFESVTVNARLHHRHHTLTADLARNGEIVPEGGEIDLGPGARGAGRSVAHGCDVRPDFGG